MNVLHLSNSDKKGGAGIAAHRLHRGLRDLGVDSHMLVQHKVTDDDTVHGPTGLAGKAINGARGFLDSIPLYRYPDRRSTLFSPAWVPDKVPEKVAEYDPDIVHLHWINNGFLCIESIREFDVPVIWTLHDMWAFTGGCHYTEGCEKYQQRCGSCPHLATSRDYDLSRSRWTQKHQEYSESNISIVTPSQWLATRASESALLGEMPIEVIPNGIDTEQYRPRNRAVGIEQLGLDPAKKFILFGADYETNRKGGDLFKKAIEQLDNPADTCVLTFGSSGLDPAQIPIAVRDLGYVSEEELQLVYSTADVTVVPSRQDNLPNIGVESICSGTPVVAFAVGGLSDIITHGESGYLADPFDVHDLATGIDQILDHQPPEVMRTSARNYGLDHFKIGDVANQYRTLYTNTIAR